MASGKRKKKENRARGARSRPATVVWAVVFLALGAFIVLSLWTYDSGTNPLVNTDAKPNRVMGLMGTLLAYFLYALFGLASYIIPIFLAVVAVSLLVNNCFEKAVPRLISGGVLIVSSACILSIQQGVKEEIFDFGGCNGSGDYGVEVIRLADVAEGKLDFFLGPALAAHHKERNGHPRDQEHQRSQQQPSYEHLAFEIPFW